MPSRGEGDFAHLPRLAARLCDALMSGPVMDEHYADLARDVGARGVAKGRLLDVGAGPGRLLVELHRRLPELELFGLDVSEAMVEQARANLAKARTPAQLVAGTIRRTGFPDGHFDVVACSGSFYLWDEPAQCLDEVHRIVRAGGRALVYETTRDHDAGAFEAALRKNLARQGALRRLLAPRFLRKQLALAYRLEDLLEIVARTKFAATSAVEPVALGGLPVWVRMELLKR